MRKKESDLFKTAMGLAVGNVSNVLKSARGSLKTLGILENEGITKIQEKLVEIRKNPSVKLAEKTAKELSIQIGTSLRREVVKRVGGSIGISEKSEVEALQSEINSMKKKKKKTSTVVSNRSQ